MNPEIMFEIGLFNIQTQSLEYHKYNDVYPVAIQNANHVIEGVKYRENGNFFIGMIEFNKRGQLVDAKCDFFKPYFLHEAQQLNRSLFQIDLQIRGFDYADQKLVAEFLIESLNHQNMN